MSGEIDPPRYVLSPEWDHERQRLGLLEHVFDRGATARLTALGVASGARCLELGAGGGSITRWLCTKVGPTGAVTAVDLDTRWLDMIDESNLTVLRSNLLIDDLPPNSFDVIYARAVLEHTSERERALERIRDWLAPGGWLYLENFAFFPFASSSNPPYREAFRAFEEVIGRTGTDYTWARTFPKPLIEGGLSNVGAEADVRVMQGGSALAQFFSLSLGALAARIIATGLLDAAAIADAQAALEDPDFWDFAPALVGTWGQKPTA